MIIYNMVRKIKIIFLKTTVYKFFLKWLNEMLQWRDVYTCLKAHIKVACRKSVMSLVAVGNSGSCLWELKMSLHYNEFRNKVVLQHYKLFQWELFDFFLTWTKICKEDGGIVTKTKNNHAHLWTFFLKKVKH